MAATEACAAPVQAESTDTKAEEAKPTNAEPANAEPAAPAPDQADETKETTANDAPQSTDQPAEQPADGKTKPASEKILGSFLNKSGLGKLMGGGKKKKEPSAGGEDGATGADAEKDKSQGDEGNKEQPTNQTADGGEAGAEAEDQAIEKAPENDEAAAGKDAKLKQGEKSSVRDFIRKPVARIFSHRSTEKKEGGGEGKKRGKVVRSRSLDRLEDADADTSTVAVEQTEDVQEAAGESDKAAAQTTKHMKRWHSFKKLMAQKSHKKSTDETKEEDGADGGADGAGDTSTLDSTSKSEHSGQKRWKLKRSWTFQGLKRDTSVTGFHKSKEGEKEGAEKGEETASVENDQGAAASTDEAKAAEDGEGQEKSGVEGDEEKGAAAPHRGKSVDQHANEIWTSFKKRVIPKSKKSTDASSSTGVEEGAEGAAEQEQTDDQQAAKDSGKSAKAKRTHFNRAVSLKNFIMRKGGKSTSVDLGGEGSAKEEGEGEGQDDAAEEADAKGSSGEGAADTAGAATAAATDAPQAATQKEEPAAAANQSDDKKAATAQVASEHKAADKEKKPDSATPSAPQQEKEQAAAVESPRPAETATAGGAVAEQPVAEAKTSRENGCPDSTAHNHEVADGEAADDSLNCKEAVIDDVSDKAKDGKILSPDGKCGGKGNAVAQSGECAPADVEPSQHRHESEGDITESVAELEAARRFGVLEAGDGGPPQNGGSLAGSGGEANTERCDQEEELKKMFYEAAASIVRSVVCAAAEQLEKEMDYLDSSFKFSRLANNANYPDIDVSFYH